MAQKLYEESNIQAIAQAIRDKNGLTTTYKTSEMAAAIAAITTGGSDPIIEALEITSNGTYTANNCDGYSPITVNVPQDGAPSDEELTLSGDMYRAFRQDRFTWVFRKYGDRVTTNDITDAQAMFDGCTMESIPVDINMKKDTNTTIESMCCNMYQLKTVPKINNCRPTSLKNLFTNCRNLREVPEDIDTWFDWSYIDNLTSSYSGGMSSIFTNCRSLRKLPINLFKHGNKYINHSYCSVNELGKDCYTLDEIVDFPVTATMATWTSNACSYVAQDAHRLKNLTFALDPDTNAPYVVKWRSQVLDLTRNVGWTVSYQDRITQHNSGITTDKKVKDDATYQALKNDPDWYTENYLYSRYNHDSAVATINSLPDTSAYLATAGGTNTIKFQGDAGSKTDGGAINTLTEEEIAVAAAKGWTVTLA